MDGDGINTVLVTITLMRAVFSRTSKILMMGVIGVRRSLRPTIFLVVLIGINIIKIAMDTSPAPILIVLLRSSFLKYLQSWQKLVINPELRL